MIGSNDHAKRRRREEIKRKISVLTMEERISLYEKLRTTLKDANPGLDVDQIVIILYSLSETISIPGWSVEKIDTENGNVTFEKEPQI